jgi:hypothetical protein
VNFESTGIAKMSLQLVVFREKYALGDHPLYSVFWAMGSHLNYFLAS